MMIYMYRCSECVGRSDYNLYRLTVYITVNIQYSAILTEYHLAYTTYNVYTMYNVLCVRACVYSLKIENMASQYPTNMFLDNSLGVIRTFHYKVAAPPSAL